MSQGLTAEEATGSNSLGDVHRYVRAYKQHLRDQRSDNFDRYIQKRSRDMGVNSRAGNQGVSGGADGLLQYLKSGKATPQGVGWRRSPICWHRAPEPASEDEETSDVAEAESTNESEATLREPEESRSSSSRTRPLVPDLGMEMSDHLRGVLDRVLAEGPIDAGDNCWARPWLRRRRQRSSILSERKPVVVC